MKKVFEQNVNVIASMNRRDGSDFIILEFHWIKTNLNEIIIYQMFHSKQTIFSWKLFKINILIITKEKYQLQAHGEPSEAITSCAIDYSSKY